MKEGKKERRHAVSTHTPSAYWKRNLAFIWSSQFISSMSFSFGLPFVAYYLQQDLGVKSESDLAFWLSLFGCGTPFTMMIFAPVWGALADRFGRRIMLIRSYCGGMIVVSLMGAVTAPWMLIALRLLQGTMTGCVSAAQTLVASHTPSRKSGFALGALNGAMFSGSLAGAFLGGISAEYLGYRTCFFISGMLFAVSLALVVFGVKEKFARPEKVSHGLFSQLKLDPSQLKVCLPILGLMAAVMFVRQFDSSFLALLVQKIHASLDGISLISGSLFAVSGFAGVASGFLMGLLADRYSPGRIAVFSACSSALLVLPLAFVTTIPMLFLFRFTMVFMSGGLEPVLQIWLCKKTPPESQGLIFGWAASVRSLGWMMAPLCGGTVLAFCGIRSIFIVESVFYGAIIVMLVLAVRRLEKLPSVDHGPETPADQVDSMTCSGTK